MPQVCLYYPQEATNIRVEKRVWQHWQTVHDCLQDNPDHTTDITLTPPLKAEVAHQYLHANWVQPLNDSKCRQYLNFLRLANYVNDAPALAQLSRLIAYYLQVTCQQLDKAAWLLWLQDYPAELSALVASQLPYTNLDLLLLKPESTQHNQILPYLNFVGSQKHLSSEAIKALPHQKWLIAIYQNPHWTDSMLLHLPSFACLNVTETRHLIINLLTQPHVAPQLSWQIVREQYMHFEQQDWPQLIKSPVADPVWLLEHFTWLRQHTGFTDTELICWISSNPNITVEVLARHPQFHWNWHLVAKYAQLTEIFISFFMRSIQYLDIHRTVWQVLFRNFSVRPQFLLQLAKDKAWSLDDQPIYLIYVNPHWTWSEFKNTFAKDRWIQELAIAAQPWMTLPDLEEFIPLITENHHNLWHHICQNKNITLDFIQKYWCQIDRNLSYVNLLQHVNYNQDWDDFLRSQQISNSVYWRLIVQRPEYGLRYLLDNWAEVSPVWTDRSDKLTVESNQFESIAEYLQF